jgi:iron complex transport system ATP-binding protein
MRLQELRTRHIKRLSHGELRRAWMGMALAQRPDVLLLDEPTAFLDIAHQFELLDLLSELTHHGVTIVMSMHDLWMASIYCQRVIAMQGGLIVGSGPTSEVLTAELIRQVFDVEVEVRDDPAMNRKFPLAYGRVRPRRGASQDAASRESVSDRDELRLPDPGNRPSPH